jgi:hypothetical protein
MNNHEAPFTSEFIDEQVEQLASISNPMSTTPRARLVHDLQHIGLEYVETRDRVWTSLASHVADHTIASQAVTANRQATRQEMTYNAREQHVPLHLKPPSRAASRLTQISAVLFVALLVGSMLWVFTLTRNQHNAPTTPSQPQHKAPVPHLLCPADSDFGWLTICKSHQEQISNQSKPFGTQTLTLETVYADANRVIIRYTLTPPVNHTTPPISPNVPTLPQLLKGTLTMQQGINLQETRGAGWFNPSLQQDETIDTFDAAPVPPSIQILQLHLTMTLFAFHTDPSYTSSFDFSTSIHTSWIVNTNQTVTVSGIPVTLQRVIVSPTQTRFFLSSPRLRAGGSNVHGVEDFYTITTGNRNWVSKYHEITGTDLTLNRNGTNYFEIDVYESLFSQKGTWTLQISKRAIAGATRDWKFRFTIG